MNESGGGDKGKGKAKQDESMDTSVPGGAGNGGKKQDVEESQLGKVVRDS